MTVILVISKLDLFHFLSRHGIIETAIFIPDLKEDMLHPPLTGKVQYCIPSGALGTINVRGI